MRSIRTLALRRVCPRHSRAPRARTLRSGAPKGVCLRSLLKPRRCAFCAPGCPNFYLGDSMCDLPCLTEACGYDGGDCGVRTAASACEQCGRTKCRECFTYGSAECVGCADEPHGCAPECSFCSLCRACAQCYAADRSNVCKDTTEQITAHAAAIEVACANGVMSLPPTCEHACREALQSARAGDCWARVHAAAPSGLIDVVLQVCGGTCDDDVLGLELSLLEFCEEPIQEDITEGFHEEVEAGRRCPTNCAATLHELHSHACFELIKTRLGEARLGVVLNACPSWCASLDEVQTDLGSRVNTACLSLGGSAVAAPCTANCAAALSRARHDVCWDTYAAATSHDEGHVMQRAVDLFLAGQCEQLGECGIYMAPPSPAAVAPVSPHAGVAIDNAPARLLAACAPEFSAGHESGCSPQCREQLDLYLSLSHKDPCGVVWDQAFSPGYLESIATVCLGGCNSFAPIVVDVVASCASTFSGPTTTLSRCTLACHSALQQFSASALSKCPLERFEPTLTASQLEMARGQCEDDPNGFRCVKQFTHLVRQCGLSLDDLASWGRVPVCTADCPAAMDMFKQFACHDTFNELSRTDGGSKLRIAWTKLQTCRPQKRAPISDEVPAHRVTLSPSPPAPPHTPPKPPLPPPPPPAPSPPPPSPGEEVRISGVALGDGYLGSCLVFVDVDGSGSLDIQQEPYTTTSARATADGSAGAWTLSMDAALLLRSPAPLLRLTRPANSNHGCVDLATGLPPRVDLSAPLPSLDDAHEQQVAISPISSLLAPLRALYLPPGHTGVNARERAGAEAVAARTLTRGLGLAPRLADSRALLAFDPLTDTRRLAAGGAMALIASSHTMRTVEILHAAFPLHSTPSASEAPEQEADRLAFVSLARQLALIASGDSVANSLTALFGGGTGGTFRFTSARALMPLVEDVANTLRHANRAPVRAGAGGASLPHPWDVAVDEAVALSVVVGRAIEDALSSQASHAPRLIKQLAAIAIAVDGNVTSCLERRWTNNHGSATGIGLEPFFSCKARIDEKTFAALVEGIQHGSQRAAIGCASGCDVSDGLGVEDHGHHSRGSGGLPPRSTLHDLQGAFVGAFVASASLFLVAFVLAARRGVLPPALARRMPPVLRPPRHAVAHDARGIWVPMDSPLYAHVQMYSTEVPDALTGGDRGSMPLASQLGVEQPPSVTRVDRAHLNAGLNAPIVMPLVQAVPIAEISGTISSSAAPTPAVTPASTVVAGAATSHVNTENGADVDEHRGGARRWRPGGRSRTTGAGEALLSDGNGGSDSIVHVDERPPDVPAADEPRETNSS